MTPVLKPHSAAMLLALSMSVCSAAAWSAPELRASATEVMVGDTLEIEASSGSSMLPVYAKDWNVSSEFSLIAAGRTGARIKALAPGFGTVSANVNLKSLSIDIKVAAPRPAASAPIQPVTPVATAAVPATPAATAAEVATPQPGQKPSACQQEISDRKQEIAQDFNTGNYDAARTKLLDLKKTWQEDGRWADALLGAINMLAPIQPTGR